LKPLIHIVIHPRSLDYDETDVADTVYELVLDLKDKKFIKLIDAAVSKLNLLITKENEKSFYRRFLDQINFWFDRDMEAIKNTFNLM